MTHQNSATAQGPSQHPSSHRGEPPTSGETGPTGTAIMIGGGPAGLTGAYEFATRTRVRPVVLEQLQVLGGIARTEVYKGNRIDIGGHRFFSKSDRVMRWWLDMLPLEQSAEGEATTLTYQRSQTELQPETGGVDPEKHDEVMLVRSRLSRIYFLRQFFDYPLRLSVKTASNLGPWRLLRIGISYLWAHARPIRPETNLEEFLINRFGRELYLTFFKSYTEKVWGTSCSNISAEWGAQRIKGLSLSKALYDAIIRPFRRTGDLSQKERETSLIERFLYPKLGPGQMWETCAKKIQEEGGEVLKGWTVERVNHSDNRIVSVEAINGATSERQTFSGDYFASTMPVRELVRALDPPAPEAVRQVSEGLVYRDFLTVGLLLNRLRVKNDSKEGERLLKDNWIYIQERDVHVGRLQIFNNWSPYLVADPETVWVGLEYFCNVGDELWEMSETDLKQLAVEELSRIEIIDEADVRDATVIRCPKAYPAYFGSYDQFDVIREYLDQFENLFLIGRNGMHRYNNQDHSMLTAMVMVDNVLAGRTDKENIWAVNTESTYHEAKDSRESATTPSN